MGEWKKKVTLIKTTGEESVHEVTKWDDMYVLAGCRTFDSVNLRDGRVMMVDDVGMIENLPVNPKATELYHSVCKPGTIHQIHGDVLIVQDADFE